MKRKAIKICLYLIILLLSVFAIYRLNTSKSEKLIIGKRQELNVVDNATLVSGANPSTYEYKTKFGSWEYTPYTYQMVNGWHVPYKPGYEVYCVEANAHVRDIWELRKAQLNQIFGETSTKKISKSGSGIKSDIKTSYGINLESHRI